MENSTKVSFMRKDNFNVMEYISILSIIILVAFFTILNKNFLSVGNIKNILTDIGPLLVMSCGVTFVLLLGSIDLGIGSVCSCSAVILVVLLPKIGYAAYFVSLVFGMFAGWLNGFIHVKAKIPSFIVTLGAMSVWQSVAYLLCSAPILIKPQYWPTVAWARIKFGVISMPIIIALLIVGIFYVVQEKTKIGKSTFAIGANERAARIAGININFVKISVFTICGLCSALAGIFLAAKLRSGIPNVGEPFNLLGVAAAALGGTALTGGKGSVIGTILGVGIVIVIQNGLNVIGVGAFWQQIVFGILVILAVILTVDRSGRDVIMK